MKISYGKGNIIVLLISLLLGGTLLFGVNRYYVNPLREKRNVAESELQNIENSRDDLLKQKAQIQAIESSTVDLDDIPTLIPTGDLQPEQLLVTLAEAAETAGVILKDQRFGVGTPVQSSNETEENTDTSLIRTTLTLSLEGDNEAQFQEFIQLLEQDSRLIQVESFTLDQTISNTVATSVEPTIRKMSSNITLDSEVSLKNDAIEYEENEENTENVDENRELEENTDNEITDENTPPNPPQTITMRANVTIVVYFFEI